MEIGNAIKDVALVLVLCKGNFLFLVSYGSSNMSQNLI